MTAVSPFARASTFDDVRMAGREQTVSNCSFAYQLLSFVRLYHFFMLPLLADISLTGGSDCTQ